MQWVDTERRPALKVPASSTRLTIAVTAASTEDATAVAASWRSLDDVRVDVVDWPPDLTTAAASTWSSASNPGMARR